MTAPGSIGCRIPYSREVHVRPDVYVFVATSNAMIGTSDLAARLCVVRIRKQPAGYAFHQWPEGDLLQHVVAHQAHYLAAVHSLIRAWHHAGRPTADPAWHNFRSWASIVGGIVHFAWPDLPPLGEGHAAAAHRTATPAMSWLRAVALEAIASRRAGEEFTATGLVGLCEGAGIEVPGIRADADDAQKARRAGWLLGRCFSAGDVLEIEDVIAERTTRQAVREDGGDFTGKYYRFTEFRTDRTDFHQSQRNIDVSLGVTEVCAPCAPCAESPDRGCAAGPRRALDPDRPGPTDLLSKAQYQKYRAVYDAHDGDPGEKHAAAWRAALADGEHGPQADPIARPRPDGEVRS